MYGSFNHRNNNLKRQKLHVKTGDTVKILSGKSKGKQGKIVAVSRKEGKVIVEGANIVTKHVKPKKAGQAGGRIQTEGAIRACKVQLICTHCGKPTRISHKINENGKKQRICKKCNEIL